MQTPKKISLFKKGAEELLSDLSSEESVSIDENSEDDEYVQGKRRPKKAPRKGLNPKMR